MTDDELIDGFAEGTIPPGGFDHRAHLRLTWLYLQRYGRSDTERLLLAGLRALAARAGKPDKFNAALTLAWIARLDEAAAALPRAHSLEDLLLHYPELLDRRTVREVAQTI
jgi:hypothetical protein